MLQVSCEKYIEENVLRNYRFLKWHCSIKPYDSISRKYFSQNSHGSIMLITGYYIIYDSLGHILLSYIWILSVIISLKVSSHYLIKCMLFLDCLLLKLGGGWLLLFGCTFAKTYFVISSKLSHNSISRHVSSILPRNAGSCTFCLLEFVFIPHVC